MNESLKQSTIAVLGAGSWGTALAILLARQGQSTYLWARDAAYTETMQSDRRNSRYLPDTRFPETLQIGSDLAKIVAAADDILIAVPSHAFRALIVELVSLIRPQQRLIWASKGFEPGSGKLMNQVIDELMGTKISTAIVSGPTFAKEVAQDYPTTVTVASVNHEFARQLAQRLHGDNFRAYTSHDVIGVQVGGAIKNVLAIAAGIADGLGFGANTRAAIITRGLSEVMRFGIALGGQRETFMGLSGLGDLVLTCTDDQSRNRRLGLSLGRGNSLREALATIDQVVEGVQAAHEVNTMAIRMSVDMPICDQVYQVLYESKTPKDAVQTLLSRDLKGES
ncbi:MAG: NAD(P)H-dependent glycerol-3-phosphate dehydrogenase [Thiohalomonadales bacterium]